MDKEIDKLYFSSQTQSDGSLLFEGSLYLGELRGLKDKILNLLRKDKRFYHENIINPTVTRLSISKRVGEKGCTVCGEVAIGHGHSICYTIQCVDLGIKIEL